MIFNGDGNNQDLVSDIDFCCSTNNNTYPLASKVRNFVFGLAKTSSLIMKSDRRWKHVSSNVTATLPIAVQDFTAGQDNIPLETKHLKILRVRMTDRNGVLQTITPGDRNSITNDQLNGSGNVEVYDKIGFSIMPYPVPNYGGSIEIEYQPGAAVDLPTVASTDWEVGFNQDFERLPGLYASRVYCALHARDRLPAINDEILTLETNISDFYESRDIDDEPSFDIERTSSGPSLLL